MTARVLAILLAIAVAGDAALAYLYLGQRDKAVTYQVREGTAVATGQQCSDGTKALGAAADKREKDAGPARQAAADKNRQHQANAQRIMSTPPAVPGDACASAQVELDAWWTGRVKP